MRRPDPGPGRWRLPSVAWSDVWEVAVRYVLLPFIQGVALGLGQYGTRYLLARYLPAIAAGPPPATPATPRAAPAGVAAVAVERASV